MAKELIITNAKNENVAVDLTLQTYKDAAEAGMSLPQHLAQLYPTNVEKEGSAFEQLLAQTGIQLRSDKKSGFRASRIDELLNPKEATTAVTRDGIPASRILFPAVLLETIEDKLLVNRTNAALGLSQMIAVDTSISGERFERAVLNYDNAANTRAMTVSQLALPNAMLLITSSERAMRIPTWAIGLEISEQAMKTTGIDFVALTVARQAEIEANARAEEYILSFLNGDADLGMAALSTISGKVVAASSLDAASSGGTLTQTAWLKWLTRNSVKRTIDFIITDLNTAMKIENRVGKPVADTDESGKQRMNTSATIVNPKWPAEVKIFLTDDVNWPANTILGIDSRYAVHRVNSLTAQYSAIEAFAMKRSTAMRFDKGELLYRLYDEAFEVLTLT